MTARPDSTVDLDRWDSLAGFDLVSRGGGTVFKVGPGLLKAGGRAVEAAVEEGFPAGTELRYEGGSWVVVLPYDRDAEPDPAAHPADLAPAPGYEWVEHDGRPVLRLLDAAGTEARPAFHPPGGRSGWRWRPAGDLGWVLIPPPGPAPASPPTPPDERAPAAPRAPTGAPAMPPGPASADAQRRLAPQPLPVEPPAPSDVGSTAADRLLPAAPAPAASPQASVAERPAPTPARRSRLLDAVGIVLIALGLVIAAFLLLDRGGDGVPDDAAAVASLLGVAPADLLAAVTPHEPGELATSVAPPTDPLARIVGTALVLIDVDADDAARLAESATGTPAAGQQLVVLLELAGDAPSEGAGYRYALLDAGRPVVQVPEGDDGDGLARLDLLRAYLYDPALDAVAAEPGNVPTGAFATHEGRYVVIGAPRTELAGGTVFGHAVVRPVAGGPVAYMLSPPYQFD